MLTITNMDSYYGESRIVDSLCLDVPDGKIVGMTGRNGVGKTTTLGSIMGLVKTPRGSIRFQDREISGLKSYERSQLGIGYVPQGRRIFPRLTVQENLEIGLHARGRKAKVPDYIYDLFPILPEFAGRKGGDLSGGQQQQLAIARALATDPKIIILDEPTEGIQPSIIENIGRAIRAINQERGITVLIVEQYLDFVMDISDEIYVMQKGQIVFHSEKEKADKAKVQELIAG